MITHSEVTVEWAEKHVTVEKAVLERSRVVWAVWEDEKLALVCGFVRESFVGYAAFWLVPLQLSKAVIRACFRLQHIPRSYGRLQAYVYNEKDKRFAEFFGFKFDLKTDTWLRGEL